MYKALYRKYRPKNFNEIYGQDVIKKTIVNEIKNDKISHAYLFCGPRGTGKTSVAKLVAKLINCENSSGFLACNSCESCVQIDNNSNMDIIEIDAASNNGVDEIRELKENVKFLPTISKYKVYIIDEVHMLSVGAFNALLKTLEEPPKHVVFILATTESQKIPVTIISRCQKFDFKKINCKKIFERLRYIATEENIKIEDDALREISLLTDGGLRDAIGLLDKLISYTDEVITEKIVHDINYTVTRNDIQKLVKIIYNNDVKNYINIINEFDEQGKDIIKLIDEVILCLRDELINGSTDVLPNNQLIVEYINFFNELSIRINGSNFPKILVETAIFSLNSNKNDISQEIIKQNTMGNIKREKKGFENKKIVNIEREELVEKKINTLEELKTVRIENTFSKAQKNILNNLKNMWNQIHKYSVDNVYGVAAGMLLDSEVVMASNDNLLVVFPYESMATRANEIIYLIEKVLEDCFKCNYKFIAISSTEWEKLKKEYIKNIKNGVKYKYVKEIISYDEIFNGENSIINDSIELFGSELLQIV